MMKIRNVRLRIRYKRRSDLVTLAALTLLTLALVTAACLGTLAWGQKEASASAPAAPAASADMRKYYITESGFDGNEALTACASGYHMASLWEILDPSNLEYNTALGFTRPDSGAGPPTKWLGWVRTGWDSTSWPGTPGPGQANCEAWTTDSGAVKGTIARLPGNWTADLEAMHVWEVDTYGCGAGIPVWCVENYSHSVYLPLVVKD